MDADRLIDSFERLYNGKPWIDVTIASALGKLTANQAAKRILPNCNSIWEIVNHIINWRLTVLKRVQGQITTTPENNYFYAVEDDSVESWTDTLNKLDLTQKQWIEFLKAFKIEDFDKIYPVNRMTYYENIEGIIQHDAYHLGQIVLLSKLV